MAPCPVTADDDGNVKIHSSPLQRMGSALHSGMCHCLGVPGIASGRADGHGFWTEISGAEAPFEMGIAVSLRAPDCKTSFSSIGSSGMGLAQGSGIAYSDASRPQEMDNSAKHAGSHLQPPRCLSSLGTPEEEAHCSAWGQPLPGVYEVKNTEVTVVEDQTIGNTLLCQRIAVSSAWHYWPHGLST